MIATSRSGIHAGAVRCFGTRSGAESSSSICCRVRTSGSFFSSFGSCNSPHRIDAQSFSLNEKSIKGAQRRKLQADVGTRLLFLHQREKIIAKIVRRAFFPRRSPSMREMRRTPFDNKRSFAPKHSVPLRESARILRPMDPFSRGRCSDLVIPSAARNLSLIIGDVAVGMTLDCRSTQTTRVSRCYSDYSRPRRDR